MSNKSNLSELEEKYRLSIEKEQSIEARMTQAQIDIKSLENQFEIDLKDLKATKILNLTLREQIFEMKKNNFKEMLSLEGIKIAVGGMSPLLSKIKDKVSNKAREVKDYVDGTSADRKWVNERYEEYKAICLERGEEVKDRTDFEKIALTLKENEENMGAFSVRNILNKAGKEVSQVKNNIKSLGHAKTPEIIALPYTEVKEVQKDQNLDNYSKKEILSFWIADRSVSISIKEQDLSILYNDYIDYVLARVETLSPTLIYNLDNGTFLTALKKSVTNIKYNKESKKINLSSN